MNVLDEKEALHWFCGVCNVIAMRAIQTFPQEGHLPESPLKVCGILGYNKFVYCTLQLVLLLALVLAPEYMVVLSSVAT